MARPTEKQIKYAEKVGVRDPESFDRTELSKEIDRMLENKKKTYDKYAKTTSAPQNHTIVKNINEKPHSFEFGRAGARHKIYYDDINELKERIQELIDAGFAEKAVDGQVVQKVQPDEAFE